MITKHLRFFILAFPLLAFTAGLFAGSTILYSTEPGTDAAKIPGYASRVLRGSITSYSEQELVLAISASEKLSRDVRVSYDNRTARSIYSYRKTQDGVRLGLMTLPYQPLRVGDTVVVTGNEWGEGMFTASSILALRNE